MAAGHDCSGHMQAVPKDAVKGVCTDRNFHREGILGEIGSYRQVKRLEKALAELISAAESTISFLMAIENATGGEYTDEIFAVGRRLRDAVKTVKGAAKP